MARTPEGRQLTEQHKRAQIALGVLAEVLTAKTAKLLDPDDLDGTEARWTAAQVLVIESMRARSARLATDYLHRFREVEGMEPSDIAEPDLTPAIETIAWVIPTIKARTAHYGSA